MTLWKSIAKGAATLLGVSALYSSFFVVDQKEHAVVTRFGNPKHVIVNPVQTDEEAKQRTEAIMAGYEKENITASKGPGLYFKMPFVDSVKQIDRRILRWDGFPEQIATKDKKYLWVDTTIRVCVEDPLQFYRRVGTEEQLHARLDDVVDATTRNAIGRRELIEIVRSSNRPMRVTEKELEETVQVGNISEGREKVIEEVCSISQKTCEQYGLKVLDKGYLIKGLTYVDDVKKAVEGRMISERNRLAEKYLSEGRGEAQKISGSRELRQKEILSAAYAESQRIRGDAEATATDTYGNAYGKDPEFYSFLGTMKLYEDGLSSHTSFILGTDNELFGFIKNPRNSQQPTTSPAENN